MTSFLRILHLEDNPNDADLLKAILSADGIACEMERVETKGTFSQALQRGGYDLIISDYTIPGFDGLSALSMVQEVCPEVPFMFVSGTIGEEVATESLKHGARDYVLKNRLSHVGAKIRRTLREAREHSLRKDAEQGLRESERLFRSVWNNSRDGMRLTDKYGMIVAVNEAYCTLTGLSAMALTGNSSGCAEISPVNEADQQDEYIRQFADRTLPALEQRTISWQSGRTKVMEISHNFIESDDQSPLLLTIYRDRTERSEAERLIHQQATLLDKAQDAIMAINAQGEIICWNKGAERLFGWTAVEATGHSPESLLLAAGAGSTKAAHDACAATGEWKGELVFTCRNGATVTVESRWTRVDDGEGKPSVILMVNTDVTEKKQLQAHHLRGHKLESIGTLACGLAHDINNTLSPILLAAHLLRSKVTGPDELRLLSVLETSAHRGAEMVTRVMSFVRGETGEFQALDVGKIVETVTKSVREQAPESVRVSCDLADELHSVRGDAGQLHQVLLYLTDNAREAVENGGGTITLRAANANVSEAEARKHLDAKAGPHVEITVTDTGAGVPAAIRHRIFDPFFTTKAPGKGSGLGLAAALGLVRGHGGFIALDEPTSGGAVFRVFLPALAKAAEELPAPATPGEAAEAAPQSELILVVEDESMVREIVQRSLEFFKYRVLTAGHGKEALELFNTHRGEVKLVLTDMMMPVMDGPSTIRAIRALDQDVKIIAVSGMPIKEEMFREPESKVHAFMGKPFATERLIATIRNLLTPAAS